MTGTTIETTSTTTTIEARTARADAARAALELIAEQDPARRDAGVRRLFAPSFRVSGPARDLCPPRARSLHPGDFEAFEHREVRVRELVESGDRVTAYIEFAGTRRGVFCDERVEGRRMHADGIVIMQFEGDLIAQAWAVLRWL